MMAISEPIRRCVRRFWATITAMGIIDRYTLASEPLDQADNLHKSRSKE